MNWLENLKVICLILLFGFIGAVLFFRCGFEFDWKDSIQTSIALITVLGIIFAWQQIKASKEQSRTQFEDSLAKECRELILKIPVKVFLNKDLTKKEYQDALPFFFNYIHLTNQQIFLRQEGRISIETWKHWQGGIKAYIKLLSFNKAWEEIKMNCPNAFQQLRKLEEENFNTDPEKLE